jgi:hypothetical protein
VNLTTKITLFCRFSGAFSRYRVPPTSEFGFNRFLREQALAAGVGLDVAMECSTWTQVIDAIRVCGHGGFLPKDLENQFPAGFAAVVLPGLPGFAEDFVIAWSAAEADKRPEIGCLVKRLGGK